MSRIAFTVVLFVATLALAQGSGSRSQDDGNGLVIVSAILDRRLIEPGQDLRVKMTITAGPKGAYLPNSFRRWDETCQSGFSVDIFTLRGDWASDARGGCFADLLGPGAPAKELLADYVFLKAGESRSWQATLSKIRKSPGTYEVRGEYFSAQNRIEEVAALPEVHGLMVVGHVHAKALRVRIRPTEHKQ